MKYYLAIDIGASSGRHIVGWLDGGEIKTKEVYRFPNWVLEQDGHLIWDMEALLSHVKAGIDAALAVYPKLESLSIDTWGCDYVLLRGDTEVLPCYTYRDKRTEAVIPYVHAKIPFHTLYRRTGSQFQPFNTVYQLCADQQAGRLDGVTNILMIPEYLTYKLTGVKAREYTNATTTGLISAESGAFDREIIERLGLPAHLFPELRQPGTVIGAYKGIPVVLCAMHDTASAVEGIAMEDNSPYISSGTWSLLGVKTERPITDEASEAANWSNEGGVRYNRYQKNIMGMWLVNRLRSELCPDKPFSKIVALAEESSFDELVDANSEDFLSPSSMSDAFARALNRLPPYEEPNVIYDIAGLFRDSEKWSSVPRLETGDYFRCAYRSLAWSYKTALDELERNTGRTYDRLYIVGGGAKNQFLNELTAEFTQKQVIALPIEATAIGNLKIQMEAQSSC